MGNYRELIKRSGKKAAKKVIRKMRALYRLRMLRMYRGKPVLCPDYEELRFDGDVGAPAGGQISAEITDERIDKLVRLYTRRADAAIYRKPLPDAMEKPVECRIYLDQITENPVYTELRGWCASPALRIRECRTLARVTDNAGKAVTVRAFCEPRPNVDAEKGLSPGHSVGFTITVKKACLAGNYMIIRLIFEDLGTDECFAYELPFAVYIGKRQRKE